MNIGFILLVILGCLVGGLPILYLVISMIAMIIYKVYRKIKYGASLYD